jgi:hypothetical protein
MRHVRTITVVALLAAALACCSDDAGPDADAGVDAGTDADADAGTDAGADTDTGSDTGLPWLEPGDISFEEVDPPLAGDFIYYGLWGNGTDSLEMISADGATRGTRFRVSRLWSFGVAHDGRTVAFSAADPYQEEHWGVTIGDAIQYTWLLRPGEPPVQITSGSINDECHVFSADDATLFLCRRAGFWQKTENGELTFGSDPYRILTHALGSAQESWLTPLVPNVSDIGPAPVRDGRILFWRQEPQGTAFSQTLMRMDADGSGVEQLLDGATGPVASPDGDLVAYRQAWSTLEVAPADDPANGTPIIESDTGNFYGVSFSPDQSRIAYLLGRDDAMCSDLWIADADGTDRALLLDCVADGIFPSGVAWAKVD